MRTGGCTPVQQRLSREAAAVLKHALGLARRRGHAQVTPLHVAAAMLGSAGEEGGGAALFRRACFSSHPHHRGTSHPLHCRALELCFSVALNRLPTSSPPSPVLPSNPAFSNALVAALKRAQAHHRRGSADPAAAAPPPHRVELEQLVISILDDPSVSRVMREAGFSSICVKKTIEDRCHGWGLLHHPSVLPAEEEEDEEGVKFLAEALIRNKKRRTNAVVVGDSVQHCERLVGQLMLRVRKGKVPEELRSVNFVSFPLCPGGCLFMGGDDVERRVSELRRKVEALMAPWSGGVVVYVGDLRWAETTGETEAADHLVAEVGRLVMEIEAEASRTRVWLVATASYQTYLRCKTMRPSLESLWALQPVPVPSDGLALSLHAQSAGDRGMSQNPLHQGQELGELIRGAESTTIADGEASILRLGGLEDRRAAASILRQELKDRSSPSPFWLQLKKPDGHQEGAAAELPRKWNMMNQSLEEAQGHPKRLFSSRLPWTNQSLFTGSNEYNQADSIVDYGGGSSGFMAQSKRESERSQQSVGLEFKKVTRATRLDLWRRLRESIPWQSETTRSIAEALLNQRLDGRKGAWLLVEGDDVVGKRRLPVAIAESICGSRDRLVPVNLGKPPIMPHSETIVDALRKDPCCVVSVEEIHRADADFLGFLAGIFENGEARGRYGRSVTSSEAIFVLATSSHPKRSAESDPLSQRSLKNQRTSSAKPFDLNVSAEAEEEEAIAGDSLCQVTGGESWNLCSFLGSIAARVAMNGCPELTGDSPFSSRVDHHPRSSSSSI